MATEGCTPVRPIKLYYFKETGKYYSTGELTVSSETPEWEIVSQVRLLSHQRRLPGLTPNHSAFHVYVGTQVPALVLAVA